MRNDFHAYDPEGQARKILRKYSTSKKLILVCWEHHALQAFARALGARQAPKWSDDRFDLAWLVDDEREKARPCRFVVRAQRLLYGDRAT